MQHTEFQHHHDMFGKIDIEIFFYDILAHWHIDTSGSGS